MTFAEMLAQLKRDRVQLERAMIALAVIGVAGFLAFTAHKRAAPILAQLAELTSASRKVSSFASGFRPLSAADENRLLLAADTITVAMPPGARLVVGQTLAADAEQTGLRDVRVLFAKVDSTFIPPRGNGPGAPKTADYLVSLEGHGTYAQLLDLLNRLPPGVSVVRLGASATATDTRYRLTLAVYETTNGHHAG